jgi:hypothetical protein
VRVRVCACARGCVCMCALCNVCVRAWAGSWTNCSAESPASSRAYASRSRASRGKRTNTRRRPAMCPRASTTRHILKKVLSLMPCFSECTGALTCEKFCQRFDEMQSDEGIQNIFRLHCSVGSKGRQKSSKVPSTVTLYNIHKGSGGGALIEFAALTFKNFCQPRHRARQHPDDFFPGALTFELFVDAWAYNIF